MANGAEPAKTAGEQQTFALGEWQSLFNGKDMSGWSRVEFGGGGDIEVEDGHMVINMGVALSGIRRTNGFPTQNYEIEVRAMKELGTDFGCAITFPVGGSHATFIAGGWGGALVGLSSLDGLDASENETTTYMKFELKKWYLYRVRVLENKIQAWINGEKFLDANIKGRRVSMRPGEIEENAPFGIANFQATTRISDIRVRTIPPNPKKIVLLAGKKSHGPGEHDYEKSLNLLKQSLEQSPDIIAIDAELHQDGWPINEATLEDADSIVIYSDGSDHNEADHPLLRGKRLNVLKRQMDRGAGLVAIHYAVFVPGEKAGKSFLEWIGGYFDYETGSGANKWHSKIETKDYTSYPAGKHPVLADIEPFTTREEYYFNIKFPENKKGWTPLITFDPNKKDSSKVVGWAVERENGGRGVGYTGGHFAKNFENATVQKFLLNSIIWSAKGKLPDSGITPGLLVLPSETKKPMEKK
ncbi:MAG: ThuA domain-containing protein [Verrucomicrobiales bacterium]